MPLLNAKTFKKKSLSDEVYDELRHQIIIGNLHGDERLDIFAIAEKLGVSRTPVKDAFNRLELEGLLTIHPNRGTYVTSITRETITHVFDVRLMIEMWAMQAASANRAALDLGKMAAILDCCEGYLAKPGEFDWEKFVAADRDLHHLIVNSPGNPLITRMYGSVFPQIQLLRVYWSKTRERALASHQQHLAILAALRRGSAEQAKEALSSHIHSSRQHILGLLDGRGNGS